MNSMTFQDIVKGRYGRKIAYTDVERITRDNVVNVLGNAIGVFNFNKVAIKYLWDYKNGDQPSLYRTKTIRDDVCNKVVENRAFEIVRFKTAQSYGEPIMYNSLSDKENVNKAVDRFNGYLRSAGKASKDISMGEWQSATGAGYEAVQLREENADLPFRLVVPSPMNTFVIYQRQTQEPIMSVQELKDEESRVYYQCFTKTHEYRIQNSSLLPLSMTADNTPVFERLHTFGEIPIVEYPNNQDRLSDVEIVITLLDAIDNYQSQRVDSVEQFVNSFIKFVNCDVDEETFQKMKMRGAFVVKSNNGSENKADVDIMTQELNQTQTQVAKEDLWDSALDILAIPNRQENGGGDRVGATYLRGGWDHAKQAARIKDAYIVESEYRLSTCIRNAIRVRKGDKELPLTIADYEPVINHSPTDNMQVKAQTYQMLVQNGIAPIVAIKTTGLWNDPEKVYLLSKPYLDNLYKTIDDAIQTQGLEDQVAKAQELIANGTSKEGRTEQSGDSV